MNCRDEVLIIDDEVSIGDALKLILEDNGYRVTIALNGRDGIDLTRTKRFALTITDLRLPDMTGLDVLRAIRLEDPGCTLALITSHGTPEAFATARDLGASAVLSKPFIPAEVLQLVSIAVTPRTNATACCTNRDTP